VEATRTFVGAKPVIVQFTATLDTAQPPQLRGQPQMQVVTEPPFSAPTVPAANGPPQSSPDGLVPLVVHVSHVGVCALAPEAPPKHVLELRRRVSLAQRDPGVAYVPVAERRPQCVP